MHVFWFLKDKAMGGNSNGEKKATWDWSNRTVVG